MIFKILIADDDYINRRLLISLLKKELYSVEVIEAIDGKNALEICDKIEDIQLILVDIEMPVMDGSEFIKQYRNRYSNDVPILAISSNDLRATEMLYMGANAFLVKPITSEKLIDAIVNVQKQ